ncbi:MAG: phosphoglycerate mutase [Rudaea sp.]
MSALNALTLLLPSRPRAVGYELAPTLLRLLARGDRLTAVQPGRDSVLRECFQFTGTSLPVAALTRSLDAGDAPNVLWLRADPAYVIADAVTLRLVACGNLDLSAAEIDGFARSLKPLFGDAGFPLEATRADRWYLYGPREATLPIFSIPDSALGDDLALHLPEGENAQRWRRLLNEVQIVLTQHPLNAQRTRRGLPPVNSLWIWGAGVLPEWVRSGFDRVISNDDVLVALASLAHAPSFRRKPESSSFLDLNMKMLDPGLRGDDGQNGASRLPGDQTSPARTLLSGGRERNEGDSSLLIDLADQRDIGALERDWFTPLDSALRARKVDMLHLLFESGERYVIKPAHRWRFWRRVKPLT